MIRDIRRTVGSCHASYLSQLEAANFWLKFIVAMTDVQ
jgi:hypothetical protein